MPGKPLDLGKEVRRQVAALPESLCHLELGVHRRQRAAQLVRRVGHEGPLPLARAGQPVQHGVEGDRQRVDLVRGVGHRQPFVPPRAADPRRAGAQRLDRAAACARSSARRYREHGQQQRVGDQQRPPQDPLAAFDVADLLGHDHGPGTGPPGPPARPPRAAAR